MARSHHRSDSDTSQHLQDNRIVCLQTISPGYCSLGLQSSFHWAKHFYLIYLLKHISASPSSSQTHHRKDTDDHSSEITILLINLRKLVRKFLHHLEFRQIQFGEIFSKHKVEISEECIQAPQMLASTFQTDLRPFKNKC